MIDWFLQTIDVLSVAGLMCARDAQNCKPENEQQLMTIDVITCHRREEYYVLLTTRMYDNAVEILSPATPMSAPQTQASPSNRNLEFHDG